MDEPRKQDVFLRLMEINLIVFGVSLLEIFSHFEFYACRTSQNHWGRSSIGWEGNICFEPSTGDRVHWSQLSVPKRFRHSQVHYNNSAQTTIANSLAILSSNIVSSKESEGKSV